MLTDLSTRNEETVLVTGGSGFIAGHIIKQLLERGYNVRSTVRDLGNHQVKYKYLYDLQTEPNKLQLFQADLTQDDNWDNIIRPCTYIISVASPIPRRDGTTQISDQSMIDTAVSGIKRLLKFSLKYQQSIKRFVLTGSTAACEFRIAHHNKLVHSISTDEWSDVDGNDRINPYQISKTLSEQYLWQFMKDNDNPFEGVAIMPGWVIGPLLTTSKPGSVETVNMFLNGEFPFLPNCNFVYCDVREVALAHVNALTVENADGKRYLMGNHGLWFKDIALILHDEYGKMGYNIPLSVQYDFVWKVIGMFDSEVRDFVVAGLGIVKYYDCRQTMRDLGVQFRPLNESVIECAESLIQFGFVKKPSRAMRLAKTLGKVLVVGGIIAAAVSYIVKFINTCQ
eukprot:144614_1